VRAPPPKASNSAAKRLVSSKSSRGCGFCGCHCRLGRRFLAVHLNKLGVFAGEGQLEDFFDRMGLLISEN
jgi:hypothetical protein